MRGTVVVNTNRNIETYNWKEERGSKQGSDEKEGNRQIESN
jgi:hypothetical protein